MTPLPTPTEELEIRRESEESWRFTSSQCPDLTPRQAFIEGHYLALWSGVLACRATRKEARRRIERLEVALALTLLTLVVAIGWGVVR